MQHRLAEARDREAKIKRTVQTRKLLSLKHRLRIWQTCSVTSALFGNHPIGLSPSGAIALRQWFHRQLRAVTNEPAHINHISNHALREKYGARDPVDTLFSAARNKLAKLKSVEKDITNTPAMIRRWEAICEQIQALTTSRQHSLRGRRVTFVGCTFHRPKQCASIVPASTKSLSTSTRRKKHGTSPMNIASTACRNASTVTSSCTQLVHLSNTFLCMPAGLEERQLRRVVAWRNMLSKGEKHM